MLILFEVSVSRNKVLYILIVLNSIIIIYVITFIIIAGFEHKKQPTSIDLNAVRLCFQVFLEGSQKGKFTHPLTPVVSDPIFDKSNFYLF